MQSSAQQGWSVFTISMERPADLGDHESFDLAGVWDMGTNAQVDHWPATVDSGGRTIGNLRFNKILFVFVVLR
jgi:hypothetical protein